MSKFKLNEGINEQCTNEEYHGDREYVSSSVLKYVLYDPEYYYKHYVLKEPKIVKPNQQKAFDFGSLVHAMILEPHIVDDEFAFYTGGKIRRGEKYTDFCEANKDKIVIMPSQKDLADSMKQQFHANPYAPKFLEGAVFEETVCTEINGVKVKVRTDLRQGTNIGDVKTTASGVSIDECINTCIGWKYDLSAALYCDVLEKVTGKKHDFYFYFISKQNGQCRTFKASEQFIENGRRKYLDAIEYIKEGRKTGIWQREQPIKELIIPESAVYRRNKGESNE